MVKDIKNSNRFLSSMIHYTCLTLAVHKTMPRLHVVESILTCLGNTPFPHNLKIHGLRLTTVHPANTQPPPPPHSVPLTYLAKSFHLTQPSTPFPCYITQCPMDPAPSLAAPSSPYVLTHLKSPCLLPEDFRGSHVALHKTMPRLHVVESILTDKRIHLFPTI